MFLRNFVLKGYMEAIGKLPDYQIRQECLKWYDKGVLLEEDLIEINETINKTHIVIEQPIIEPIEEIEEGIEETEVEENEEKNYQEN